MWRGVSLRQIALLLIGPMIVETIWTLLVFWMGVQTTALGYAPKLQNIVVLLPAFGYAASSLVAGRWVTPRHATKLMLVMLSGAALLGLSAVYVRSFALFVVLGPVLGLCIGHYYVPFQIRMGHVQPFRTLAWTVAFYNIAWGTGGSVGPYIAGLMVRQEQWVFTLTILLLITAHAALVFLATTAPRSAEEHRPTAAFASTAHQRKLGWIAFAASGLMIRGACFTLMPDFAHHRDWSPDQAGLLVLSSYCTIPLGALLWARLRHLMTGPILLLMALVIGAAGMAMMPLTTTMAQAMACIVAVGVAESCTVFHALYYSNADPSPASKGRSIAMVEVLAGCGSVAGPALLGLLAWSDATRPAPWWTGSAVLLVVSVYLAINHHRQRTGPTARA